MTAHGTTHNNAEPAPQPLAGRTVVITRARAQAGEFATALEKFGARVIVCPTIEIAEPTNFVLLDEAIDHLYGYDWLVFTSVNGVDYFLRRFHARGYELSNIDEVKVCAIGEATAQRLRDAHIHVDVVPREFNAEGVFASLAQFAGGVEALSGLNFLIPRAAIARDYLPRALEAAGARVDVVPAYRTVLPDNLDRGRITALLAGGADCIAFTSSSTVRNLAQLFDTQDLRDLLKGVAIACIGNVTARTAAQHGLDTDIQPEQFTIIDLAQAINAYFLEK